MERAVRWPWCDGSGGGGSCFDITGDVIGGRGGLGGDGKQESERGGGGRFKKVGMEEVGGRGE